MRFWNTSQNQHEDILAFENKPTALTVDPYYNHIIVGFESGKVQVYDTNDFQSSKDITAHSNKPIPHYK